MNTITKLAITLLLVVLSTSCSSTVNPEKDNLQLNSQWLGEVPIARPVDDSEKFVYLSIRNTTMKNISIREKVKNEVQKIGYTVTGKLEEAHFILMVNVCYYGSKSESGYVNTAGGAVIAGTGSAAMGNGVDIVSILIGGIIGSIADGFDRTVTKDIVIDIHLGEKVKSEISTKVSKNKSKSLIKSNHIENKEIVTRSGFGVNGFVGIKTSKSENNSRNKNNGDSKTGTNESSDYVRQDKFFYHEARLVVSAEKLRLSDAEAIEAIVPELSRAVGQVLP